MNDGIEFTAARIKDLYPCVGCGTDHGTTTVAFEQVGKSEHGATRAAMGALCEQCFAGLQDPRLGEAAHRKLEERLTQALAKTTEGHNHG